jgi:hypothetical protein
MIRSSYFVVVCAFLASTPLAAQERGIPPQQALEFWAQQAIETLRRSLGESLAAMPQFEPPEINENGDIVIRRKRGPTSQAPKPAPRATKRGDELAI